MTTCSQDLVVDLQEMIETLQRRADRNRQRATEGGDDKQQPIPNLDEFAGLPFLVIPVSKNDDGDRPLPSRPEGAPPIPGGNPEVYDADGGAVREIEPGGTYEFRCEVLNAGDLHVSMAAVEFFVEHRSPSVVVDPVDGPARLAKAPGQVITGYTSYPPGTKLLVYVGFGDSDERSVGLDLDAVTVDEDRTFAVEVDLSGVPEDRSIYEHPELRVNVFSLEPSEILERKTIEVVSDPPDDRGPLDLGAITDDVEFVGRQRVRIPSGRSTETSIGYTAPERQTGVGTIVYARAYTMAPIDTPNEWGWLDPRPDRHVGRTEVYWV